MENIDVYVIDKEKDVKLPGKVVSFYADKNGVCKAVVVLRGGEFVSVKLECLKERAKWN